MGSRADGIVVGLLGLKVPKAPWKNLLSCKLQSHNAIIPVRSQIFVLCALLVLWNESINVDQAGTKG